MNQDDQFDRFLSGMYPCEMMRGSRIERLGGKSFADFVLDVDTAQLLGCENVGVFIQNCGELSTIKRRIQFLDAAPGKGKWIAVMGTDSRHWVMYNLWHGLEGSDTILFRDLPNYWKTNNLVFTTPEKLSNVLSAVHEHDWLIAGIILVDLECNVHKARGNQRMQNDRPQHLVDFRASLTRLRWAPPLILMTQKFAQNINAEPMWVAYCLEAWWYVDGTTFSFRARNRVEET